MFDTLSSLFLFVFIIAFVTYKKTEQDDIGSIQGKRLQEPWYFLTVIGLVVGGLLVLYYLVILPFSANRNIFIGYRYVIADSERSSQSFLKNNTRLGAAETAHQINSAAQILIDEGDTSSQIENRYVAVTRNILEQAVAKNKFDVRNRLYLGQLLSLNPNGQDDLDRAEEILLEAIKLSPGRPEVNYLLFNLYLAQQDQGNAVIILEMFIKELPWFGEPKLHFANTLKATNPEQAARYFEEGITQEYRTGDKGVLLAIIEYLLYQEDYERVVPFYQRLINNNGVNSSAYKLDLAKIYFLLEDFDASIRVVADLNETDPVVLQQDEAQTLMSELQQYTEALE